MSGASRIFVPIHFAVIAVSDTRTVETDRSGGTLKSLIEADGHKVLVRAVVKDDIDVIEACLRSLIANREIDCIVSTGGTGVTGRDVTPEAVERVADKMIPGFGELFRYLSIRTIGTSTIQSRATACVAGGTYIFALPGSTGACEQGWTEILRAQFDARTTPCNFVELVPRLLEK